MVGAPVGMRIAPLRSRRRQGSALYRGRFFDIHICHCRTGRYPICWCFPPTFERCEVEVLKPTASRLASSISTHSVNKNPQSIARFRPIAGERGWRRVVRDTPLPTGETEDYVRIERMALADSVIAAGRRRECRALKGAAQAVPNARYYKVFVDKWDDGKKVFEFSFDRTRLVAAGRRVAAGRVVCLANARDINEDRAGRFNHGSYRRESIHRRPITAPKTTDRPAYADSTQPRSQAAAPPIPICSPIGRAPTGLNTPESLKCAGVSKEPSATDLVLVTGTLVHDVGQRYAHLQEYFRTFDAARCWPVTTTRPGNCAIRRPAPARLANR